MREKIKKIILLATAIDGDLDDISHMSYEELNSLHDNILFLSDVAHDILYELPIEDKWVLEVNTGDSYTMKLPRYATPNMVVKEIERHIDLSERDMDDIALNMEFADELLCEFHTENFAVRPLF